MPVSDGRSAYADRVQETTNTAGTGTITLLGAVADFQSFTTAFQDGARVRYVIQNGVNWEVGDGIFTAAGPTLSRQNVYSSSNAGALVNFPVGTANVWCDLPGVSISDIGTTIMISAHQVLQ